jgi:hypothetical protein
MSTTATATPGAPATTPVASVEAGKGTPAPANDKGKPAAGVGEGAQTKPAASGEPKTGEQPKGEGAPSEKKFKLKVNGKDIEVSEADLVRNAQIGMSAEEKFKSAAKIKKDAEMVIHLLKTNPWAVLSHPSIGHDPRKMSEEFLMDVYNDEKLTPEQREAKMNQKKLRELELEKQARQKEEEERKISELQQIYQVEYQRDIIGALEKSQLPKTPNIVRRISGYLYDALERGIQLKAIDVIDLVREDLVNEFKTFTGGMESDILMQIVGEEGAKKIREYEMKRVNAGNGGGNPPTTPDKTPAIPPSDNKLTPEEWREAIDKRLG